VQKYDGTLACRSYRSQNNCITCFRVFLPVAGASGATAGDMQKAEPELAHLNHRAWQAV
jgi:hypothetical protein